MAWSYDASDLDTTTESGRLNVVRYLVGDTDTNDQQIQNEEITLALSETSNNVYAAASYVANTIASKYARKVDTKLDGALSAMYSQLQENYKKLAATLESQGRKYSGSSLGVSFGGLRTTDIDTVRADTTRVTPSFRRDRFRFPNDDYLSDYEDE